MEKVRMTDVDRPEEVAKVLNEIISKLNENDKYNEAVEKYNDESIIKKGT
jgi:CRISPR/Cas system CSM-associated protein Csm2 small subunit